MSESLRTISYTTEDGRGFTVECVRNGEKYTATLTWRSHAGMPSKPPGARFETMTIGGPRTFTADTAVGAVRAAEKQIEEMGGEITWRNPSWEEEAE